MEQSISSIEGEKIETHDLLVYKREQSFLLGKAGEGIQVLVQLLFFCFVHILHCGCLGMDAGLFRHLIYGCPDRSLVGMVLSRFFQGV